MSRSFWTTSIFTHSRSSKAAAKIVEEPYKKKIVVYGNATIDLIGDTNNIGPIRGQVSRLSIQSDNRKTYSLRL